MNHRFTSRGIVNHSPNTGWITEHLTIMISRKMGISLSFVIPYCIANLPASRQFYYDARDQTRFFRRIHFEYFCLTSFFPSVFTSHGASNSQVSEVSKILFMFFMMSEAQWTAVENVVFLSKRNIVIKLPGGGGTCYVGVPGDVLFSWAYFLPKILK